MTKFTIVFVFMTMLFPSVSSGQTVRVDYVHRMLPDTTESPAANSFLAEARRLRYERYVLFSLRQQDHESVFAPMPYADQTGLGESEMKWETDGDVCHKDFQTQTVAADLGIALSRQWVVDSLHAFRWAIQGETASVLGYTCHKATTTICGDGMVVAWFSPDFPISNGPLYFGGLPGLILRLEIGGRMYIAQEIVIDRASEASLSAPKLHKPIAMSAYCSLRSKALDQLMQSYDKRHD